jgi:hypothetical protein
LTFLVGYTWSKAIDIGGDGFFSVEGTSIQDPYNTARDRSVAGFDLTHVVSAGWAYEIPHVNTASRALDTLVNHWQINGILTASSGLPYDVGVSGDPANTGNSNPVLGYYERLDLVGDPNLSNPTPAQWLNKSAFAVPPAFTFGTMGRNALRGDGAFNLDLSLFKDFPISESKRFEFRAEAFNFTNTPTWGLPGRVFNNANFGVVTSTQSVERQIQFALKFYF